MTKQVKNCSGKESYHRMNYLLQASKYTVDMKHKNEKQDYAECADFISNYYSNLVISIAKKSVLRIDTEIKRTICKGCHNILIPGKTAKVRVRRKPTHHVRWTCEKCCSVRVFNTISDYNLWNKKSEAVVETLEYVTK